MTVPRAFVNIEWDTVNHGGLSAKADIYAVVEGVRMNDRTVRSVVLTAAFTALIVVGAIFSFPAPWNPAVPFTMANFFVILSGMLLGPRRGLAAVGLYLLLGFIGLPVFAGGGAGLNVMSPGFGFLLGYALAAFTAGWVTALILAAFLGVVGNYAPGVPWMHWRLMGTVDDWSWASTWGKYTAPFLVGDGLKAAAAVVITGVLRDRIGLSGRAEERTGGRAA